MNSTMTWEEICADPRLRDLPFKIEQDRYGRIVMSPAGTRHARYQGKIAALLAALLPDWSIMVECGVTTPEGVKVPDVAAMPNERAHRYDDGPASFPEAPELCVEVASPGNHPDELAEKLRLHFAGGGREGWICSPTGEMTFYAAGAVPLSKSALCPEFPAVVDL